MTECSPSLALFPLPRKPVVVTADGGAISSDAGALLLRELDAGLGLSAALARCLREAREPGKVRHSLLALLQQRIH
jgi:hypothetical protein